mmetsp:Transcript_1718/g.2352  ORF Transcript_1718/g.2352 Transcript_1718/m.2352 type:complete len:209 (-) Transcript_1718:445-1071(-)
MHLFLTGNPGVGKTTCIQKVLAILRRKIPSLLIKGFYTKECREGSQRIGFDLVSLNRAAVAAPRTEILARVGQKKPKLGKYSVNVDNVRNVVARSLSLNRIRSQSKALIIIDEVGKMEILCDGFFPAVEKLLDITQLPSIILGTIPISKKIPQVDALKAREDTLILMMTKSNRDELATVLASVIFEALNSVSETSAKELLSSYIVDVD